MSDCRRSAEITRRRFLRAAGAAIGAGLVSAQTRRPNVVFIYADDLGYGDLGCYGSKIRTPNIDAMAGEGTLFRNFYSASPLCSPSRAALLTGRYPVRTGVTSVLFPADTNGLPDTETTIAQMLKTVGYKTMCVGKWHLGSQPQFLPTRRGFDEYFGLPYSNDMWPLPLLRNTDVIEQPPDLNTLTPRYTEQAVNFIARSKDAPFFLYMPHTYPHIPLAASESFRGDSALGLYGDVVEEIDWSVGEILRAIKDNGIDGNTLVMFASDNGPWYQGSPGRLRGRKGMTYEGGVREPFIARFPGRIPAGAVSRGVASTMDILPTLARLCNAPLPDNPVDGIDIWPLLTGDQDTLDREALLYFNGTTVECARWRRWKLHLARPNSVVFTPPPAGGLVTLPLPKPELYDVEADPEEAYNVADRNPEVVAEIRARIERLIPTFPPQVGLVWRETMGVRVEDTPEGSFPIKRTP